MSALPPQDAKAREVRAMFDRIAPGYDRMNRLLTLKRDQAWRRTLLNRLAIGPQDTVLDLACGTGDFAEMVQERGARVVGLDFSRQMLVHAGRRGLGGLLIQGDANRLPLATDSVSVAVSGFALRNFVAIPPMLAELARVIAPGGRLGILEVDRPQSGFVRAGHAVYFDRVMPLAGRMLADPTAYCYLSQSVVYLPPQKELVRMLQSAGFHQVRKKSFMFGAIQAVSAVRR